MLSQRARFKPALSNGLQTDYVIRIGYDRFRAHVGDGRLDVARGETKSPNAIVASCSPAMSLRRAIVRG